MKTMTKRHPLFALALAGTLLAATSAPSFAGEVTGNGKLTRGGDSAASACHFSGLNDHPNAPPPEDDFPGKIQNFAHFLFWLSDLMGFRVHPLDSPLFPGDDCRGNLDGSDF
jgi:hypothetical protein